MFNDEFSASGDKRANKSVSTKNYEFFRSSDLQEEASRVVKPILSSLEGFQERDSEWTLLRILNLTVNINKYNPLHTGCHIELLKKSKMKSDG